jgi:hypothetical protein
MVQDTQDFRLFRLLHGDSHLSPLFLTRIPRAVSLRLGWNAVNVFVTLRDAKKIRHHPMHGMNSEKGLHLPMVIRHGDYYQSTDRGSDLQVEVVLHEMDQPKRAYFLVLSRNKEDTEIFMRNFYFSSRLSRNKMKLARKVFIQSTVNYFK